MELKQRTIVAAGMAFAALEVGDGPLVLCLHGFPDQPRSFAGLMQRLAERGFHAVAPAMRGYWPTGAAPDGQYREWATGSDALALISALGHDKAVVIGHDWGASAAYAAATLMPERVDKLVTMAVPYGPQLAKALLADGDQQRRSWYMFFFLAPLAERALKLNDFALLDRLWAEWSPGYRVPEADRAALKAMFAQPGVVEAALSYYRQEFSGLAVPQEWQDRAARIGGPIAVPALYLHGRDDGCIGADLADGMEGRFTAGLRKVVVENAGHFLHLEQPARVADEILAFLAT